MLKLFRSILSADRKRRSFAVRIALRLLMIVRDIEKNDLYHYSDKLDEFDLHSHNFSQRDYISIEEKYSDCEFSLGFLESAIEDLEFAY